ncbi:MAG: hypothetical protein KGL90_14105 [Burkholderiales bacterium]|nr:hypothetical protein [Burkholderiales bacterium]
MSVSPFFLQLHSAYQAEMDDLSFDSEGRDVLRQRLVDKRKELSFLLQMIEVSPEMVAVVFHQGFRFPLPAVMDHLLSHDADELPEWDTLADAAQLTPWAQDLMQVILSEPMGPWFMTVAASLEYMRGKLDAAPATPADEAVDDDDGDDQARFDEHEDDETRARDEAGADWMVEQGFDRKD